MSTCQPWTVIRYGNVDVQGLSLGAIFSRFVIKRTLQMFTLDNFCRLIKDSGTCLLSWIIKIICMMLKWFVVKRRKNYVLTQVLGTVSPHTHGKTGKHMVRLIVKNFELPVPDVSEVHQVVNWSPHLWHLTPNWVARPFLQRISQYKECFELQVQHGKVFTSLFSDSLSETTLTISLPMSFALFGISSSLWETEEEEEDSQGLYTSYFSASFFFYVRSWCLFKIFFIWLQVCRSWCWW